MTVISINHSSHSTGSKFNGNFLPYSRTETSAHIDAKPAIAGGEPTFSEPIPIARPVLPTIDEIRDDFNNILTSGMITNSTYVRKFEQELSGNLHTKCTATSNCTTGLMLVQKCLELKGEIIAPSFTFCATIHSIIWNNLKPVFADCDPETFNIDVEDVRKKITPETSAIIATHISGNPCEINQLEALASEHNVKLIFDAAHGLGSSYNGKPLGCFGDAEVFSLSPTKVMTSCEGGIVSTNDYALTEKLKAGIDYGNSTNLHCDFLGLNGRMPEFNAVIGLSTLKQLNMNVKKRNHLVSIYKKHLSALPWISFQKINGRSSYKDLSILISKDSPLSRDFIVEALEKENIMTRKYFFPPAHQQKAYQTYDIKAENLPVTEDISKRVLSLPLYTNMKEETITKICQAVERIYSFYTKKYNV